MKVFLSNCTLIPDSLVIKYGVIPAFIYSIMGNQIDNDHHSTVEQESIARFLGISEKELVEYQRFLEKAGLLELIRSGSDLWKVITPVELTFDATEFMSEAEHIADAKEW